MPAASECWQTPSTALPLICKCVLSSISQSILGIKVENRRLPTLGSGSMGTIMHYSKICLPSEKEIQKIVLCNCVKCRCDYLIEEVMTDLDQHIQDLMTRKWWDTEVAFKELLQVPFIV